MNDAERAASSSDAELEKIAQHIRLRIRGSLHFTGERLKCPTHVLRRWQNKPSTTVCLGMESQIHKRGKL
jgi:hypothetical protein